MLGPINNVYVYMTISFTICIQQVEMYILYGYVKVIVLIFI